MYLIPEQELDLVSFGIDLKMNGAILDFIESGTVACFSILA